MSGSSDGLHAVAGVFQSFVDGAAFMGLGVARMCLGAAFMGLGVEYGATCVLTYVVVRNFLPYVAHCQLAEESSIEVTHDTCNPMDSS